MRKKIAVLLLSACTSICLFGCSESNIEKAHGLIEEENYLEAYELIDSLEEDEIEKNAEDVDEILSICKYQLGKNAFIKNDFEEAISYLESINYEDSQEMVDTATEKINTKKLISDIAAAIDARYAKQDELKSSATLEAYKTYVSIELEALSQYKENIELNNDELKEAVWDLIKADEDCLSYLSSESDSLNKKFLNYVAANGDRIMALNKISSIHSIPVSNQTSIKTLKSYKEVAEYGAPQRIYKSLTITENPSAFTDMHFYTIEGENTTDCVFEDFGLYFEVLDPDGNLIGHFMSETIGTLRPGQKFKISANSDSGDDIDDINNTIFD